MEFENIRTIHSSEKSEIVLGESDGKQYIKKTGGFSREAVEKIAETNSPYIARIAEIGEDYIITEYADGGDLSKIKLPPKQVFDIALKLCAALRSLHENNIIHRDIKPSNIILCSDGHIKLIDFDAARIKKSVSDKDTRFVGTDGFAPPEQYGFSQTDERSDIYAFGVTIKLLLGKSYDSSPYKRVIEKCIRFNPDERYGSVKAVKAALLWSRFVPIAAILLLGGAVCAALIVFMNYQINSDNPELESDHNIESSLESDIESYYISNTDSSSTNKSNSAGSTASASSTSNSNSSSSISSSSSSSSLSSSSSSSSSLSSSSSSSLSSSSSSSSSSSLLVPPPDDKVYPVSWNLLTLPKDFPRLRNGVEYYAFFYEPNSQNPLRYFITWDILSNDEIEYIARKSQEWLGSDARLSLVSDDNFEEMWSVQNSEYKITVGSKQQDGTTYFNIFPKNKNYTSPEAFLKQADPTAVNNTERPREWDESFLKDNVPKLTDKFTIASSENGAYYIYWKYMDLAEAESIVKKIINFFDGEYKFKAVLSTKGLAWVLEGDINGRHALVEVYFWTVDSYCQADCKFII